MILFAGDTLMEEPAAEFDEFRRIVFRWLFESLDTGRGFSSSGKLHRSAAGYFNPRDWIVFNGNCAHETDEFLGERYSFVRCTVKTWRKAKEVTLKTLETLQRSASQHVSFFNAFNVSNVQRFNVVNVFNVSTFQR